MPISDTTKEKTNYNGSHPDLQSFIATNISNSTRQTENNATSPEKIKAQKGMSTVSSRQLKCSL